jgi:hypothetical protein
MSEDNGQKINGLPEELQNFYWSDELSGANLDIFFKYDFAQAQKDAYFEILDGIFLRDISLAGLSGVILSKLGIGDDKKITALAADIKNIFVPFADYFGIAEEERDEAAEAADEIIKKKDLKFDDEGKKRFLSSVGSYVSGVRTEEQFKEILMKDAALGGLGMEEKKADDAVSVIAKTQEEVIPQHPHLERSAAETELLPKADQLVAEKDFAPIIMGLPRREYTARNDSVTFSAEEKEAAGMVRKTERLKLLAAPKVDVEKAIKELQIIMPSEELNLRLKNILDSRARGARTNLQMLETLMASSSAGGIGFSRAEADKVSLIFNKYLAQAEGKTLQDKLAEIKKSEEEDAAHQAAGKAKAEATETKKLNDKFAKLTGKETVLPAVMPPQPVMKEIVAPMEKQMLPQEATMPVPQTQSASTEIASLQVKKEKPAAKEKPTEKRIGMPSFIGKIFPVFQTEDESVEAKAMPKKSPAKIIKPAVVSSPLVRPIVEDIVFTPKLFGPLEEIGQMTIADFRRLGNDSQERMKKIKDKLRLLRDESFKKYQSGSDLWKKSPVYSQAVEIVKSALEKKISLPDAIKEAKTLTPEEFDVIMNEGE